MTLKFPNIIAWSRTTFSYSSRTTKHSYIFEPKLQWGQCPDEIVLKFSNNAYDFMIYFFLSYRKVASSNTSCLEAHAGFLRLLMKGIFYPYVLRPFDKKLISYLISNAC